MRSKSASDVCTSRLTPSNDPTGKKSRVWSVVNATIVAMETTLVRPPSQ